MALILVVDDEHLITTLVSEVLSEAGHETAAVAHGALALEQLHQRRPDLIITDFMMPIMTGLELAQTLRGADETAALPIILITGGQGLLAREHGELFDAILDKPFDPDALVAMVQRLLRGSNSRAGAAPC
jgi:CheY-like chemotaxis protein